MKTKMVSQNDIGILFERIDRSMAKAAEIIIIGGGAMALRGEKMATKDVDIVIPEREHHHRFIRAIEKCGFVKPRSLARPYRNMGALVFKHPDGYWLDVFSDRICDKFLVHPEMIGRMETHKQMSNLTVRLMSREDIFLAKSFTEREGDLDDMYVLFTKGLDERVILEEAEFQSRHAKAGQIWESFLKVKLDELEDRYDITVPFKRRVERMAIKRMEKAVKIRK
jgi:hypothetical protein